MALMSSFGFGCMLQPPTLVRSRIIVICVGRGGGIIQGDPPHSVSEVVRYQESAGPIDCQTNRPSARLIVRIEEACDDVLRRATGPSAAKRHENHLVPV